LYTENVKKKVGKTSWSVRTLLALGIPMVLIPGLLLAHQRGWNPDLGTVFQQPARFPHSGSVKAVEDGDTFVLSNDQPVRLIGINAPERGSDGFVAATTALNGFVVGKTIHLEYDRYQDDKYGRLLAWVWVDCESDPVFLPADYMYLSRNESRPGLMGNPQGCKNGTLVNEAMVKTGFAKIVTYADRGELKYEKRLQSK
jgi:endonuclease YncB( thermonuclease family)